MTSIKRYIILSALLSAIIFVLPPAKSFSQGNSLKSPKLVLQITVDQLRGDMPGSVYDRLGKGGFRYLYEKGVVYENAHHRHANTETVVGHVTPGEIL